MADVYLAEVERFGYTLKVADKTEKKAVASLTKEYNKTYIAINNCKPQKYELDAMREDINVYELEFGKVEWT